MTTMAIMATVQVSFEFQHQWQNRDQHTNNTEANPLLLPGGPGSCDSHGNLLIALVEVLDNLLALLLNLHNGGILLDD